MEKWTKWWTLLASASFGIENASLGGMEITKVEVLRLSPMEIPNCMDCKSARGDLTLDFYLTVAPSANVALCLAIVIAIQEMNELYT